MSNSLVEPGRRTVHDVQAHSRCHLVGSTQALVLAATNDRGRYPPRAAPGSPPERADRRDRPTHAAQGLDAGGAGGEAGGPIVCAGAGGEAAGLLWQRRPQPRAQLLQPGRRARPAGRPPPERPPAS